MQLAEKKTELETGKTELTSKKEASTAQLAATETQLVTAKADAEAAKIHLTLEITTLEATNKGYNSAIEQAQAGVDSLKALQTAYNSANDLITLLDADGAVLTDELVAQIALLTTMPAEMITDIDTAKGLLNGFKTGVEDQLTAQGLTVADLDTKIAEAEATIAELQASVTLNDTTLATLKSSLSEIETKITTLDAALTQLYQGNLTAAIEFANAQTAITLGETQIATAEAQLDSAESQIEAGEEQLKAGEEQITSGEEQLADTEEQLADALQQILDGEVELEEARLDAYDQADMNGVLTVDTVEALLTAQNFSMPAGYVTEEGISYLIRVGDKPDDIESLKAMPLLNLEMDGVDIITLGDVADVFMTDNSADIYANVNGEPGIMVTMQKQTGYSTGEVTDNLIARFEKLEAENPDLNIAVLMDQGVYIDMIVKFLLSF